MNEIQILPIILIYTFGLFLVIGMLILEFKELMEANYFKCVIIALLLFPFVSILAIFGVMFS